MKTLWHKKTGEARQFESVDAREILVTSDEYTEVNPEGQPVPVASVENEFRREPVGDDAPEKPRDQDVVRNPTGDAPAPPPPPPVAAKPVLHAPAKPKH